MKFTAALITMCLAFANADCYLSNPKGSNNRLNEKSANRQNANRLFDSQNNNRGGYNVGDKGTNAAQNAANKLRLAPSQIYPNNNRNDAVQYPMLFYAGSEMPVEWTVQHGCGGNEQTDPNKLNCNMVLQYICDQNVNIPKTANVKDQALTVQLADGTNTNTPNAVNCAQNGNKQNAVNNQENQNNNNARGRHESEGSYCECQMRNRQTNLFTADQNVAQNRAQYTRQNPNGGRRGLECPEERDYYPYWAPTQFRDLAYLTDDVSRCKMIQSQSQNVKEKYKCTADGTLDRNVIKGITEDQCTNDGGDWTLYAPFGIAAPDCQAAGYSRVNHLGNGRGDQVSPDTVGYNATIPTWATLTSDQTTYVTKVQENEYVKCALRVRYNISTDDYDPWTINAQSNNNKSPVKQNPNVNVGASAKLQLAINTNQFGRTFQDRTHTFYVRKPTAALATAMAAGKSVVNLNVRGKRGNIVQTYPAHEYDFVPAMAEVRAGDLVHIQWTGSNTHNNGNPGGDGQTGDAGEGTGGTDRHNILQFRDFDDSFYAPFEKLGLDAAAGLGIPDLFGDKNTCGTALDSTQTKNTLDCALYAATSGYYKTANDVGNRAMNPTLDNTPASTINGGQIVTINAAVGTTYMYGTSRNNNFTNRGQKGEMRVVGA